MNLGILNGRVNLAPRSRKGCGQMSGNGIVQIALNNTWPYQQWIADMKARWITIRCLDQTQEAWPEPPDFDPHDRWCGSRDLITPGYSFRLMMSPFDGT